LSPAFASRTPALALSNARNQWLSGVIIGLMSFGLWWLWIAWGRAFQVALAAVAFGFALAFVRFPQIGLAILGFVLASNIANYLPGSTTAFLAGMLLVLLIRKLVTADLTWGVSSFLFVAIIFVTYCQSTILWVAQDNYYNWHLVYRVLLALIVIHQMFRSVRDFRPFLLGAAAGMIFTSVSAIRSAYTFYASGVASQIAGSVTKIEGSRFFGHWPDPNIMAFTLAIFLGGVIALWRCSGTTFLERLFYLTAASLSIVAIGISLSRAGMISGFLTVILVTAVDRRKVLIFSVIGALCVIAFSVIPTDIFGRIASLVGGDASTGERMQLVLNGFRIFLDNPIFGAGMGGYEHKILWRMPYLTHGVFAHNTVVDVIVDGGLVGLALLFTCVFVAARGVNWTQWSVDRTDLNSMLNAGMRASLVGAFFTLATFSAVAYVPLWSLLALCALLGQFSRVERSNTSVSSSASPVA